MGKSVFLQQLARALEQRDDVRVLLITAPPSPLSVESCMRDLARALGVEAEGALRTRDVFGWQVEREAQHGAGRTDLKLRWNGGRDLAVVEVKIWGRPRYQEAHRQVEGYWSARVRAGAVVMLTDAEIDDWPRACRHRCLGEGIREVEVDLPGDSPTRARKTWTSTTADGTAVQVDHFLLRIPR